MSFGKDYETALLPTVSIVNPASDPLIILMIRLILPGGSQLRSFYQDNYVDTQPLVAYCLAMDVILPQQYRLPEDKIVIRMVGCVATILPTEASSISRTAA